MMGAKLGVVTCDKCGRPMQKGQKTLIITEGDVAKSTDVLDFRGSDVRYACHLDCWDGVEEAETIQPGD